MEWDPEHMRAHGWAGKPPSDAVVLFDGKDLSAWKSQGKDSAAAWKVENGYLEVVPNSGDLKTKETFGDVQLHVEWAAPAQVRGDSQNPQSSRRASGEGRRPADPGCRDARVSSYEWAIQDLNL